MPKRHDDLFDQIANFQALLRAAKRAMRGKRKKRGASAFQFNLERELIALERELQTGRYRTGRYLEIQITEPVNRMVSAAPFRDRVVQHALMDVVGPIFEAGFIGNSFANRIGKGTHKAVATYERYRDRAAHVLRCDIWRYFPAIDHAIVKQAFRRRLKCARTLTLLDTIIDGSNAQEPVNIHYPGDDLFAPYERRRGLPIGNLTSQFCANLYLDPLDHFCTEVLQASYVRYVDDFALFNNDPAVLAYWRARIGRFLERRRLRLHPRKTRIAPTAEPSAFLGYVLHGDGKRSLPSDGIDRFKRRLRCMKDQLATGTLSPAEAQSRVDAWVAHTQHAHARGLNRAMLGKNGEPFAPGRDRPFAPTA